MRACSNIRSAMDCWFELSDGDKAGIREHAAGCPDCRRLLLETERVMEALESAKPAYRALAVRDDLGCPFLKTPAPGTIAWPAVVLKWAAVLALAVTGLALAIVMRRGREASGHAARFERPPVVRVAAHMPAAPFTMGRMPGSVSMTLAGLRACQERIALSMSFHAPSFPNRPQRTKKGGTG